jgi:hypothetical protein
MGVRQDGAEGVPATAGDSGAVRAAVLNLQNIYGDQAPAEALTRALVSERTQDRNMAEFWVEVFLASCR